MLGLILLTIKPKNLYRIFKGVFWCLMLATDPISPVSCKVDTPWVGLVCSAHPRCLVRLRSAEVLGQDNTLYFVVKPFLNQFCNVTGQTAIGKNYKEL